MCHVALTALGFLRHSSSLVFRKGILNKYHHCNYFFQGQKDKQKDKVTVTAWMVVRVMSTPLPSHQSSDGFPYNRFMGGGDQKRKGVITTDATVT